MLAWLGVQRPLSLRAITEETLTPLPSFLPPPPQPIFRSHPAAPAPKMLQGITVPVLGPRRGKPHEVCARFHAQVVPLHAGLSSLKGQESLLSSSFYSVHEKIKIIRSQTYKPVSKPQSMHRAPVRGSKCTEKEP